MSRKLLTTICSASVLTIASATAANAALVGFSLGSGGSTLVSFDPSNTAGASQIAISGDGSRLDAIDFRPATGELYGYDSEADAYYLVDPNTGVLTQVDDGSVAATTSLDLDIDWNPTIDRLRTVTADDENIVFNPNDGSTTVASDLFYAVGDPYEGLTPTVTGNAYTPSVNGETTQYVIDETRSVLATLANSAGELNTVAIINVAGAPLSFSRDAGFDIVHDSMTGQTLSYALRTAGGLSSLYLIDLMTGSASLAGNFAESFGTLAGLSFTEFDADQTPVPIPAALPLFAAGASGLAFAMRRKRRAGA